MDFLSVVIGFSICAFTAVVLYFISVKSFQEKPFEEVLAEQQQFANSLLKTEKSHKDKDKKNKKQAPKKTKEKEKGKNQPQPTLQSIDFEDKPHVEFEPDTEIIPEEPVSLSQEKKKEKKEKVKPILRNRERDQVSAESFDPDVDTLNHFVDHPPKDDVEMKTKDGHKNGKKTTKTTVEEREPVEEPVCVKEVAFTVGQNTAATNGSSSSAAPQQQQQQPSTPKKKKKQNAKTDSIETIDGGEELLLQVGGTEKLLSALRQLPLTPAELQTMIEVLLNRQQEESTIADSEWMEPGGRLDPIGALRKQLADKEKALQEELEEKQAYQTKLRTLGTEMTAERTRSAAARKQLEESLARQTTEIQVLTARLQQQTDQHASEMNALRLSIQQAQKASQASEEHVRQLARLQDEKNQYEARFATTQQIQQEFAARVQQLEEVLRHKDQQFDEILMHKDQQLMEQANQLAIIAAKLQESEQARNGQNHELQREVAQLREALQNALAQEAQTMHSAREAHMRLEEFERTKKLLEDHITKVERELQAERSISAQKENELRQDLQRLIMENQSLSVQLTNNSQTRQDDDAKLASLQEQLATERSQAASKYTDMEKELERLRQNNDTLSEQLTKAAQNLEEQRSQLEVALRAKDEELETQRRKNNELRDKNYKAMDALAAAEKALVEHKKSAAAAPPSPPPVAEIAKNLKSVLPGLVADDSTSTASFADMVSRQVALRVERAGEEERSKAQSQVQHYKTVLAQTEELLYRLQSHIEAEEASWKTKITNQESDLLALRQEKDFWMDQCQRQEKLVQDQQQKEEEGKLSELSKKISSLEGENVRLQQELDKQRTLADELSKQSNQQREQLDTLTAYLAEEKRAAHALREQLDHTKAELAAAKVGSIGFMVGWAKNPAAAVAAATVRKSSLTVLDSLSSDADAPAPPQSVSSPEVPATNGNGTVESAQEDLATSTSNKTTGGHSNHKGKNRKRKGASHLGS